MKHNALCLALCLVISALVAFGQTGSSALSGTVTDTSGAVVPGANVSVINENTGLSYRQVTTDAGVFSFTALPVGPYTVNVEATGFKTTKRTRNILVVDTPL